MRRVLCLHGSGTSADILRVQLAACAPSPPRGMQLCWHDFRRSPPFTAFHHFFIAFHRGSACRWAPPAADIELVYRNGNEQCAPFPGIDTYFPAVRHCLIP